MSVIRTLVKLLEPWRLNVRVLFEDATEPSNWDCPLFSPLNGYFETPRLGPFSEGDIEWIEIDSIEYERVGRLVPDVAHDRSADLALGLSRMNIPFTGTGGLFRVSVSSELKNVGDA